jgi:hypothetical protein
VAAAVVDEHGVGEASRGRRRGRAWCGRGWWGRARRRRDRRGRDVEAARGAGNSARRGTWEEGEIGSDSRRESRSMGGEGPARGNTSSSKTT